MEYYNGKTHEHIILFPLTAISKISRICHALFTIYVVKTYDKNYFSIWKTKSERMLRNGNKNVVSLTYVCEQTDKCH